MKKVKYINSLLLLLIFLPGCNNKNKVLDKKINVTNTGSNPNVVKRLPAGANSWVVDDIDANEHMVFEVGVRNWVDFDKIIRTYFRVTNSGLLHVGLNIKTTEGPTKIKVTVGKETKEIIINNSDFEDVSIGEFNITDNTHYNFVEIQGLEKTGTYIAEVNELLIGGSATNALVNFIPTDNFYFGRRGPSIHLNYEAPATKDVQWFYNEVTVPVGEDVLGSFFMANGHAQGYFGMQVNSETERRVLFSIWSAFDTNDPKQIPDDYKVLNLGSGEGVIVQDFGNEGSGKQSIKVFNWQAGTTYKFLLKGEPSVNNSTDYTAYFYAPEIGEWQLIASLRRPQISTYLTRMYSFLENFDTNTGFISRQVEFGNQWAYTTDNTWNEMTKAILTIDATAKNGDRLDCAGGTNGNGFFLKNCGFFDEVTHAHTGFERATSGLAPSIDFLELEIPAPLAKGSH